jgi:ElaB/YqjD/DUF883 family membrane-anchored ribosome-binding protein
MSTRDPRSTPSSQYPDEPLDFSDDPLMTDDAQQFARNVQSTGSPEPGSTSQVGNKANDMSGKAHEKADQLAGKADDLTGKAQQKAGEVTGKANEMAGKAQEKADELGGKAHERADQGMDAAASGLGQAADMLRHQGEQRSGTVGTAAAKTADTLESASHYLRDKDTNQLMTDLESFVRQRPVESVLVAAGVGFVLSKIVR